MSAVDAGFTLTGNEAVNDSSAEFLDRRRC